MKIQYADNNITVFESALYRTTSTVIALQNTVVIIDPNWLPNEVEFLKSFVQNIYPHHNQYLIFTHSDYDHIIGYGAFPNATTIASSALQHNQHKETILKQIRDFDNTWYIERSYPITYPKIRYPIENDNATIVIDETMFHFYLAPGHNADAIFVLIPELGTWICGDYFSNIEIPIIDHNYHAYQQTLDKSTSILEKYPAINHLITGHGDMAHGRKAIKKRIIEDKKYLEILQQSNGDSTLSSLKKIISNRSKNPEMWALHNNNITKINNQ
jgi:hydroxyacylglutathione hydrolase